MHEECDFHIGQLVEYRAWYDGEGAWVAANSQVGIVLEIICIPERTSENEDVYKLYDVRVYWLGDDVVETVPDLLLTSFNPEKVDII